MEIIVKVDFAPAALEVLEALTAGLSLKSTTEKKARPVETSVANDSPANGSKGETITQEPNIKDSAITKTDLRAIAVRLSKAGKSEAVQALIKKFGVEKLSALSETNYAAFKADLEALNG